MTEDALENTDNSLELLDLWPVDQPLGVSMLISISVVCRVDSERKCIC